MQNNLTDRLLEKIGKYYPLSEQNIGEFHTAEVSVMHFEIRAFEAEGLGHVSLMTSSGLFGLMKMETLIINPFEKDLPLFSYDRIHAMGNDKDYLEFFETRLHPVSMEKDFRPILETCSDIPDQAMESTWYTPLILPQTLYKSGKKKNAGRLDRLTEDYLDCFLKLSLEAVGVDPLQKKKMSGQYTEGLLNHGGPSTDQFVKAKGKEYTARLFREVLFGTGDPEKE